MPKRSKRAGASAKKAGIELAAKGRRADVVSLRVDGLTFQAIGEKLGISTPRAYQLWQEALDSIVRPVGEIALAMELERCERMMAAVWPKAMAGDLDAIRASLAIMARRAKYLGLDAPTKVEGAVDVNHSGEINHTMTLVFVEADGPKVIEHDNADNGGA